MDTIKIKVQDDGEVSIRKGVVKIHKCRFYASPVWGRKCFRAPENSEDFIIVEVTQPCFMDGEAVFTSRGDVQILDQRFFTDMNDSRDKVIVSLIVNRKGNNPTFLVFFKTSDGDEKIIKYSLLVDGKVIIKVCEIEEIEKESGGYDQKFYPYLFEEDFKEDEDED